MYEYVSYRCNKLIYACILLYELARHVYITVKCFFVIHAGYEGGGNGEKKPLVMYKKFLQKLLPS